MTQRHLAVHVNLLVIVIISHFGDDVPS